MATIIELGAARIGTAAPKARQQTRRIRAATAELITSLSEHYRDADVRVARQAGIAGVAQGSTAFVTNVDFGDWTEHIGDPPLVMALLDRVVDNAIVRKFEGTSYRKHRAERKKSPQ